MSANEHTLKTKLECWAQTQKHASSCFRWESNSSIQEFDVLFVIAQFGDCCGSGVYLNTWLIVALVGDSLLVLYMV